MTYSGVTRVLGPKSFKTKSRSGYTRLSVGSYLLQIKSSAQSLIAASRGSRVGARWHSRCNKYAA